MPRIFNHSSDLDQQLFSCGRDSCDAVFTRSSDRVRHEKKHQPYTKRPFKCAFCDFRANQKSGLKCHENSVHLKKRIPCRYPECDRDFSDPSTLSRHMSRRHKLSSKKLRCPSWVDLTSTFAIQSASDPADATAANGCGIQKFSTDSDQTTKFERRSPDVSSANVTLHTSAQEGVSCQNLIDSALFSFSPSPRPTLSPLLDSADLHEPDWQFQASSSLNPSNSGIWFPSCTTDSLPAFSSPKTDSTITPPCGFQIDVRMPDAYGTPSKPTEPFSDTYFHTFDDFLVQSSTNSPFSMAPNIILPVPSVMALPPMTNYDASCSGVDLLFETSQSWQVDTPALNFGYSDARGSEYYYGFNELNFSNF